MYPTATESARGVGEEVMKRPSRTPKPEPAQSEPTPEPTPLAGPADLAAFDIPDFETPDARDLWLTLGRGHVTPSGETDLAALTTRLRALGAGALAIAATLDARDAPDLRSRAEELLGRAGDSLLVHDARRAVHLKARLLDAMSVESRLREASDAIARIKLILVESGIAASADFSDEAKTTVERALAELTRREKEAGTAEPVLPPAWRTYVEPPARLRTLLQESPARTARIFVGRELGLSVTELREHEKTLAVARSAGWAPDAGGRLVVDPVPTGRPRGRSGPRPSGG